MVAVGNDITLTAVMSVVVVKFIVLLSSCVWGNCVMTSPVAGVLPVVTSSTTPVTSSSAVSHHDVVARPTSFPVATLRKKTQSVNYRVTTYANFVN